MLCICAATQAWDDDEASHELPVTPTAAVGVAGAGGWTRAATTSVLDGQGGMSAGMDGLTPGKKELEVEMKKVSAGANIRVSSCV